MKEIILTRDKVALVDDEDFERVSQFKWYANIQHRFVYARRAVWLGDGKYKVILMHRFILNAPRGFQVDHKNGNCLDNRKSNIRLCTRAQNQWNRQSSKGKSKFKGVYFHLGDSRWRADIMVNGRAKFLGNFKDEQEAAQAYDKAALEYYGEFACTNEMIYN